MNLKPYKSLFKEAIKPEVFNQAPGPNPKNETIIEVGPVTVTENLQSAVEDLAQDYGITDRTIRKVDEMFGGTEVRNLQGLIERYSDEIIEKLGNKDSDEDDDLEKIVDENEDEATEIAWEAWMEDLGGNDQAMHISDYNYEEDAKEIAIKDWNESNMAQYIKNEIPSINELTMQTSKNPDNMEIVVNSSKPLSDEDKHKLVDWCSGQFSDGWGEGFEQQDISRQMHGNSRSRRGVPEAYVHFWTSNKRFNYSVKVKQ